MKTLILSFTFIFAITVSNAQQQQRKNLELLDKIITLTQENIFDAQLLQSEEWTDFVAHLNSEDILGLETREFGRAFNLKAAELSFSHFYIGWTGKKKKTNKKKLPPFELEEVSKKTVILYLRRFDANGAAMVAIVNEIKEKGYENLIIDLRDNSGGTLDAAVILGRFLTNQTIDAGAYVTRKWYDTKGKTPTLEDIQKFKYLGGFTYKDFQAIQDEPAFRMVLPGHNDPTFGGKVVVLTNNLSASACEPFVHVLKTNKAATIIGEQTAGQMLSANWFKVNKDISVFIPVNDYITAQGTRLDKVGVSPDIEVSSEDALNVALEQFK